MNFSKSSSVIVSVLLLNTVAILPANANLMDWAVSKAKLSVQGYILEGVGKAIRECALSTTCIPGQGIKFTTHKTHKNYMFKFTRGCFEIHNVNLARNAGQNFAKQLSQRSGVPIVFSHVRNDYFIFGVPRG